MNDETTLDLRDLLRVLKKRRNLILGVFLVAVMSATGISLMIPPTYEASTTLRIKQSKGLASSLLADLPMGNPMNTKQTMSTYAEILKSRTVVESVIQLTQMDNENIPTYDAMLSRITTLPVRDTEILKVQVKAKSPTEAQLVANTLVNTFIDRITYLVRSEQSLVREFIGARLNDAKVELERSEELLEGYKREQKIVAPAEETKAIVDRISGLNKLEAENKVTLATTQARLDSINYQLGKEKPGFIAESVLIQQYKSKLAELEVELVRLLESYTDRHPEVLGVRAAITETRSKLNNEIARVINAEAPSMNPVHQGLVQGKIQAEAELAAAEAQRDAITRIINQGEAELTTLPAKEQGLVRLMRDTMVNQEIYIMLAKRHEEARISEVMQPTDVQVIDTAMASDKPIAPKKRLNVMIGAFLGLFAGVGLAFALEYINKTIANTDDVKYYLDLPVLGNIPDFDKEHRGKKGWFGR